MSNRVYSLDECEQIKVRKPFKVRKIALCALGLAALLSFSIGWQIGLAREKTSERASVSPVSMEPQKIAKISVKDEWPERTVAPEPQSVVLRNDACGRIHKLEEDAKNLEKYVKWWRSSNRNSLTSKSTSRRYEAKRKSLIGDIESILKESDELIPDGSRILDLHNIFNPMLVDLRSQ